MSDDVELELDRRARNAAWISERLAKVDAHASANVREMILDALESEWWLSEVTGAGSGRLVLRRWFDRDHTLELTIWTLGSWAGHAQRGRYSGCQLDVITTTQRSRRLDAARAIITNPPTPETP